MGDDGWCAGPSEHPDSGAGEPHHRARPAGTRRCQHRWRRRIPTAGGHYRLNLGSCSARSRSSAAAQRLRRATSTHLDIIAVHVAVRTEHGWQDVQGGPRSAHARDTQLPCRRVGGETASRSRSDAVSYIVTGRRIAGGARSRATHRPRVARAHSAATGDRAAGGMFEVVSEDERHRRRRGRRSARGPEHPGRHRRGSACSRGPRVSSDNAGLSMSARGGARRSTAGFRVIGISGIPLGRAPRRRVEPPPAALLRRELSTAACPTRASGRSTSSSGGV